VTLEPAGATTPRPTLRQIKATVRLEQRQELLATALQIVTTEGLGRLTMVRLAEELGCGIGTIYRHVASKDALIAELQREALDRIAASFERSQAHLAELLAARGIDRAGPASLARTVVGIRFWICAEGAMPREIELLRLMFTDPSLHLPEQDMARALPASLRLLELARGLIAEATEHGALEPGPDVLRAIVVIAGTTGVLMTSGLDRWDPGLFHGQALATLMARDLLVGWGADRAELDEIEALVAELDAAGHLVPAVGP
jgi:AcrR family transcriptional regulator